MDELTVDEAWRDAGTFDFGAEVQQLLTNALGDGRDGESVLATEKINRQLAKWDLIQHVRQLTLKLDTFRWVAVGEDQ